MAYKGVKKKFLAQLMTAQMSARTRQVVEKLGLYGSVARGAVFALVGVFIPVRSHHLRPGQGEGARRLAALPGPGAGGPVPTRSGGSWAGRFRRVLVVRGPVAQTVTCAPDRVCTVPM